MPIDIALLPALREHPIPTRRTTYHACQATQPPRREYFNGLLAAPHISVEAHLRSSQIRLAQQFAQAKKIYLDTKFWLILRDVRLGRNRDPGAAALLNLLQNLVAMNRVVCPISATTFVEIFGQKDATTLQASIQLIDDLSLGLTLIEERERFNLEFFHFVRESTHGVDAVYPLSSLVWTKLAYTLGFVTPVSNAFPADVSVAMQKASLDFMWSVSLTDMLHQMGDSISAMPNNGPDISVKLNEGKFSNLHEHKSFKKLFLDEIAGILDVYDADLVELFHHLFEAQFGRRPAPSELPDDGCRLFQSLIYNAFKLNMITVQLPSLRVSASLHAAWRWDTQRKFKRNDQHDFHHAVAAVPYCDYFFTEHSLRQLLTHKGMRFSELFQCQTFSDVNDAMASISGLAA